MTSTDRATYAELAGLRKVAGRCGAHRPRAGRRPCDGVRRRIRPRGAGAQSAATDPRRYALEDRDAAVGVDAPLVAAGGHLRGADDNARVERHLAITMAGLTATVGERSPWGSLREEARHQRASPLR